MSLKYWIISARLKPLILGVGPVFLSICLSISETFEYVLNGAIIFCVLFIQIATHFFNDAFDFLKGADNPFRTGPIRAVQKGNIKPALLIKVALSFLVLAGLIGVYLVFKGGLAIFCIGVLSLILAWAYTGGPWALAYTGLADLVLLLFFGVIPVSGVFYLNTGYWSVDAIILGFKCGFLALSIFVINNLRDEVSDRKANKKTLVVRWGIRFGFYEWVLAHYISYILLCYWFLKTKNIFYFGLFILLPLSFYIHFILFKAFKNKTNYGKALSLSCLYYFLFVLFLGIVLFVFPVDVIDSSARCSHPNAGATQNLFICIWK